MGRQALFSHCNGKKHKGNNMKVKSLFQPTRTKANPSKAVETDTSQIDYSWVFKQKFL